MRSRRRTAGVVATLVVVIVLGAASCVIPIGDLGGPSSIATDINDAGVIVGVSELPGSTPEHRIEHGFRRLPDGTVVELAPLPGSASSGAVAINDSGEVAGLATMPGATPQEDTARLVRWDADGTLHDLAALGGTNATVKGMDDQGRIVGWYDTATGDTKGFVFDPAVGGVVALPDLPTGQDSIALGMNDEGDVVGYQWVGPVPTAAPVRWDLDAGTVTDLTSTWGLGLVSDISDSGTMIGLARFPSPTPPGTIATAAILRPGESAPTSLGLGSFALPLAINDDDVVVGWHTPTGSPTQGYRWTAATGAVALSADGHESYAWSVNDLGQVVGQGDQHAALFVGPAPTP